MVFQLSFYQYSLVGAYILTSDSYLEIYQSERLRKNTTTFRMCMKLYAVNQTRVFKTCCVTD